MSAARYVRTIGIPYQVVPCMVLRVTYTYTYVHMCTHHGTRVLEYCTRVPYGTTLSQKRLEIQALRCNGDTVGVRTYVHVYYVRTYQWYVYVLIMSRIQCTCVRTRVQYVRTYILIMLCHNFLIGKGHTGALRTTCVWGGYTAAS